MHNASSPLGSYLELMAFRWIEEYLPPWVKQFHVTRVAPVALHLNRLFQRAHRILWAHPNREPTFSRANRWALAERSLVALNDQAASCPFLSRDERHSQSFTVTTNKTLACRVTIYLCACEAVKISAGDRWPPQRSSLSVATSSRTAFSSYYQYQYSNTIAMYRNLEIQRRLS